MSESSAGPPRQLETPPGDFSDPPPRDDNEARERGARAREKAKDSFDPAKSSVSKRSEKGTVFDNPDGTSTAVLFNDPVNWQDQAGVWRTIDPVLEPDQAGRWKNRSGRVQVSVADTVVPGDPLVSVSSAGWEVAFGVEGAVAGTKAKVDKASARFPDLQDGVDVEEYVGTEGVKEHVVLKRPPSGGSDAVFRFPLRLTGVAPSVAADGGIEFRTPSGERAARIPPGWAWDSAQSPAEGDGLSVPLTLLQEGDGWVVRAVLPGEWLAGRTYPVILDPTIDAGRSTGQHDAFASQPDPSGNYNGARQLWNGAYVDFAGFDNWSPPSQQYTYQYFDVSSLEGKTILSAQWRDWVFQVRGSGEYFLWPVADTWSEGSITWNTLPHHRPENLPGVAVAGNFQYQDVTDWVQNWTSGTWPSRGIAIDSAGEDSGVRFGASEEWTWRGNSTTAPAIFVTYNSRPTPGQPSAPADKATLMTDTPALSASAGSDADGDALSYWFRVSTSPDGETGSILNSGALGSPAWTPPAGSLLDGTTYYWKMYTLDGTDWVASTVRSFTVDLRLGAPGVSPLDGAGPVTVNMANGNVFVQASSPMFDTVGGPMGVSYSYNSRAQEQFGLLGTYESVNPTCAGGLPCGPLARQDPVLDFNWGTGGPGPGVPADGFTAVWTGFITLPYATNNWYLGGIHDDGVKITLGTTVVYNNPSVAPGPGPAVGTAFASFVNQTFPIRIEYRENGGLAYFQLHAAGPYNGPVPASWLSSSPPSLPRGWQLSTDLLGSLRYAKARVGSDSLVLVEPDGATHEYRRAAGNGWTPTKAEDDIVVTATDPVLGAVIVVRGGDGIEYTFTTDKGRLIRAVTAADDQGTNASPEMVYDPVTARVTTMRERLTGKSIGFVYSSPGPWGNGSDCPKNPAAGLNEDPPVGMLCKINYWDDTPDPLDNPSTKLYYVKLGSAVEAEKQLARIEDPGGAITDFAYSGGRLSAMWDPLAIDLGAVGDTARATTVDYDGAGRAKTVKLPVPRPGESRPQRTYTYTSGTESQVAVAGLPDPTRRVLFDAAGRQVSGFDAAGLETSTVYDGQDRVVASTNVATDLRTTVAYDPAGRPAAAYGPARTGCFNTDHLPNGTCTDPPVPVATTGYDTDPAGNPWRGLAAQYWNNRSLSGDPLVHATGVGSADGALVVNWGQGGPAGVAGDDWSARFTGEILLPDAGNYGFNITSDDGARLFIDDTELALNRWSVGVGFGTEAVFNNPTANSTHRIRVEYFEATGGAVIELHWRRPSTGIGERVPGQYLSPRYGLATRSVDPEGKVTATEYAQPAYGQATASVADPAGKNLRTVTEYEPPGVAGKFQRRTKRILPNGPATATTYTYYDGEAAPANECGGQSVKGLLKDSTGPAPAAGPAIVGQVVYDAAHRVAGQRVVGDARWACTVYDPRGRVVSSVDRTNKTATVSYTTPGEVNTTYVDSGDATRTTREQLDLLGRTWAYTDEQGTVTRRVWDQAGRPTEEWRRFAGGADIKLQDYTYTASTGRLESSREYLSGGARTTLYGYDSAGRPTTVTGPNGVVTTTSYNGATGAADGLSTARNSTVYQPYGSWAYAHDQAGRISTETTNLDPTGNRTRVFTYDGAGRLTRTVEGAVTRDYAFDANTNRCARAVTCASPTYTYDNADRLVSSPEHSAYYYDAHGNMTSAIPRTQPGPATANDSWTFDAATPAAHATPIVVGQAGTVSANATSSAPAIYAAGAPTGALAGNATWSTPISVHGRSFLTADVTWATSGGSYANLTAKFKDQTGTIVAQQSASAGTVRLTYPTPSGQGEARYTLELQNTTTTPAPSFTASWSASTVTSAAPPASVAAGATGSVPLTAAGQGRLAANLAYTQGTRSVPGTPSGTVGMGATVSTPINATGTGALNASVDWVNPATYTSATLSGTLSPGQIRTASLPVRGATYLETTVTWTPGTVPVTARVKNAAGTVVATSNAASGTVRLSHLSSAEAASYTLEVQNTSGSTAITSMSAPWSATTVSSTAPPASVAAGATGSVPLTAAGQGRLAANLAYTQGTRSVPGTPSGTVGMGATVSTPINATGTGTVNASVDWAALPTYATATATNTIAPQATITSPLQAKGRSYLASTVTWEKDSHHVSTGLSGWLSGPGSSDTTTIDVTGAGTISLSADWYTGAKGLPGSGQVQSLQSTDIPITVKGNGSIYAYVSWASGIPNPNLDLYLLDGTGTQVAKSDSLLNNWEQIDYEVTNLAFPQTRNYTLRVTATGPGSSFTMSGSYPYTADVDVELYNPSNIKVASATTTTNKPETLTYPVSAAAAGLYTVKTISKDLYAGYTINASYPVLDYASVTARVKDPAGAVVASRSASTGSLELHHLAADPGGPYSVEVSNTSGDINAKNTNVATSATTSSQTAVTNTLAAGATATRAVSVDGRGHITASLAWPKSTHNITSTFTGTVPELGTRTQAITPTADGTITASVDWQPATTTETVTGSASALSPGSHSLPVSADGTISATLTWAPGLPNPNLDLELLDPAGNVVDASAALTGNREDVEFNVTGTPAYPAASYYQLRVKTLGPATNYTLEITHPVTADVDLELYNPAGTRVAFANSSFLKPETISYPIPSGSTGTYTIKVISYDHAAPYTLTTTYPVLDYATLTARVKNNTGAVVASTSSATGTLDVAYLAPAPGGSYALEVSNDTTDLAASVTGTLTAPQARYPNLDVELYNPAGVKVASAANTTAARPEVLTYTVPAGSTGTYMLKVISRDYDTTWTATETHPELAYANVTARFKNTGGTVLATTTTATGTVALDALAPTAGSYTFELVNNSADVAVPSVTGTLTAPQQRTANLDVELYNPAGVKVASAANTTAARPEVLTYTVPAGSTGTYMLKVISRDYDTTWTATETHPEPAYANVTARFKNTGGTVLATTTTANGTVALDALAPTAGSYTFELVNNSADVAVPAVTGELYTPRQGVSGQTVTLKNSSGQTVATGTGSNPAAITATVPAGAYTLETTPTSGAGTATTTIGSPDYPNLYQVDYDSRDHPTVIRDGQTTTTETLSPTGRVLRRTVTNAATNTTLEDTLYGYNTGGDSPAYTRPYGAGTVTTYLPGVTYTGTTATWQHTNRNGDITATTDQAGTWTPNPPTDEYGIGTTPATRLGWLGSHQRFTTNPRLGTIRMGVRLYDPTLGRFTSTDPIEGGCANAYTYVFGDPVNEADLTGQSARSCKDALTELARRLFKKKGVLWRYNRAGLYRDGDSAHIREFNSEKRNLAKAMRAARQECGRRGGPPGGLGNTYSVTMSLAQYALGLRYPGAPPGSETAWINGDQVAGWAVAVGVAAAIAAGIARALSDPWALVPA